MKFIKYNVVYLGHYMYNFASFYEIKYSITSDFIELVSNSAKYTLMAFNKMFLLGATQTSEFKVAL